jgi:hypothetical protein
MELGGGVRMAMLVVVFGTPVVSSYVHKAFIIEFQRYLRSNNAFRFWP